MFSKVRILGLLLVALTAVGAVSASGAAAEKLGAETYPTTLTGVQSSVGEHAAEHVFKVENDTLEVKCPVANFHGTLTEKTNEIKGVTAEYKGKIVEEVEKPCKAFSLNATVNMNGCTYTFRTTATKVEGMEATGNADLVCPAGKVVTVVTATCEVQIGSQEKIGPVNYIIDTLTPAEKNDLTVTPNVLKTIKYNKTKDGIGCPLAGTGEKADGSYKGNTTVTGENPVSKDRHELSLTK